MANQAPELEEATIAEDLPGRQSWPIELPIECSCGEGGAIRANLPAPLTLNDSGVTPAEVRYLCLGCKLPIRVLLNVIFPGRS
jgi:hypothetical protein